MKLFALTIFQPKPAIVHYDDLQKSEKKLDQLSEGHWHGNGNLQEYWCMECMELPVLDHCDTNDQNSKPCTSFGTTTLRHSRGIRDMSMRCPVFERAVN